MTNKKVKQLILAVTVVALASALGVAQVAQSQAPEEQSLTGTVTCEGRITHHYTCQRNQTQQTCTLDCVQQGSRFVLMVGDKLYLLEGDSRELEAYAGGKATVTGVSVSDRIEVQTASNAKPNMQGASNALPSSMGTNTSTTPQMAQPNAK